VNPIQKPVLGGRVGPEKPDQPFGTAMRPVRDAPSPGVRMALPATFRRGGRVKRTGWAKVHKGEHILTKGAAASLGAGKKKAPKSPRAKSKVKKTMGEFKAGTLHSGSKKGPKVSNPKQAIAIALTQAQKEMG
jgi:hypothetical protein